MPLGSVEEWRARIGSSWCALGRPVKSVSGGGVTRQLTGEIMLQVLYVLMMLTLVVVIQRVRKMNKCLRSGYHKELKSSIHPRTAAKRLLFIMILLLQAQSFIQSSLLLKCGDIESNPGPDLDYDNIDNSTVLTEDDLRDVFLEVVNIQTTYYQFGMVLGLPPRELDAIRKAFERDITQCFTEVLLVWLRHRYNVDRHGPPTWRRLVVAVDSPSGGNNHALAKAIASKHSSQSLDPVQTTVSPTIGASLQAYEENIESNHFGSGEDYNVPMDGSSRNLIQRCSDTMAAYYLRQVDERAWPPVKATNFINLALVKDQTSWRITLPKSVDEVIGDKENTSYYDMLNDIDNSRFILLEGRPGCGKTTLMSKISRDWSNGKILKSKLVIFVPLRSLNDEHDRSLSTLIRVACPNLPPGDLIQLVSSIKQAQGSNTVFVFDGLDEYRPIYKRNRFLSLFRKHNIEHEDVFDLLKAKNLPKALVILSSRPVASKDFRQNAGKRLEVLGFLKPQVIEYVHHYFDSDKKKAQQLISHLEHHPNLMNMAYLPLHCAMLVFLYEDGTVLPDTETEFYKHFTLSTLVRALRKRNSLNDDFSLTSFTELPHDDKRLFDVVCQLAFDATVASKQVFKYSELKHKLFEVGSIVCDESSLGLVVIDRYFMRCGHDETYTFLHLTFQEYLAAVHIAGLSEHKRMKIINTHKHAINLSVVWRFLCGMTDYSIPSAMGVFRCLMETGDILFKFQCCYESQHSSTCTHVIKYFDKELKFSSINLSPSDCTAIGCTVNANPDPVCITFENCELSSEGASSFFHHINQHPFSLTLRLTGSAMDSCLDGLKQCPAPGLLCLNLSNNKIGSFGACSVAEGLKNCMSLKNLDLCNNKIGSAGACAIAKGLEYCGSLEKLDLSHNNIESVGAHAIEEALKHCMVLKNLNFSHNIHVDVTALQAIGESLQHYTKLNLSHNRIEPVSAHSIRGVLKHCVNLENLDLSNNIYVDDTATEAIGEVLQHCTKLTKLKLSYSKFGSTGACAIAKGLKFCVSLKNLDLSHTNIEPVGVHGIGEALKHCVVLENLDLSHNFYIDDTGADAIGEGLKHCTKLTKLNLSYSNFWSDGACAIAKGIKFCVSLKNLDLSYNNIELVGVHAIGEALKHCIVLENLDLSHNDYIGDAGAEAIGEGLKHCTKLTKLNLSYNNIGPVGACAIGLALKHCVVLENLDLSYNSIGVDGACAIGGALKHCVVLKNLNLKYNSVESDGAHAVVEGLKHCPNLNSLELSMNKIDGAGVQALTNAVKQFNNLSDFRISER